MIQFRVSQSSIFSFHSVELTRLCDLQELIESHKGSTEMWSSSGEKASFKDAFPEDYVRIQLLEAELREDLSSKKMDHEIKTKTLDNQNQGLQNIAFGQRNISTVLDNHYNANSDPQTIATGSYLAALGVMNSMHGIRPDETTPATIPPNEILNSSNPNAAPAALKDVAPTVSPQQLHLGQMTDGLMLNYGIVTVLLLKKGDDTLIASWKTQSIVTIILDEYTRDELDSRNVLSIIETTTPDGGKNINTIAKFVEFLQERKKHAYGTFVVNNIKYRFVLPYTQQATSKLTFYTTYHEAVVLPSAQLTTPTRNVRYVSSPANITSSTKYLPASPPLVPNVAFIKYTQASIAAKKKQVTPKKTSTPKKKASLGKHISYMKRLDKRMKQGRKNL